METTHREPAATGRALSHRNSAAEESAELANLAAPAALSRLDAASLAHRLRNPLAAIHQSVETLGKKLRAGSQESELCELALAETRRLERTIARALRAAKQIARSACDLGRLVTDVADRFASDPRVHAGVDLTVRHDGGELTAQVDADRVAEALTCLVENALDAVARGGEVAIAVAPQHSLGTPGVRIDVRDSGPGFAEQAGRIAPAPFESSKPDGSGIGLLIARDVARAHGGFLRLRNAQEGGARVSLWLPLRADER